MPRSQCNAINELDHEIWEDYRKGCISTYTGGYHEPETYAAFKHGMETVFNLLEAEFPQPYKIFANKQMHLTPKRRAQVS